MLIQLLYLQSYMRTGYQYERIHASPFYPAVRVLLQHLVQFQELSKRGSRGEELQEVYLFLVLLHRPPPGRRFRRRGRSGCG